MYETKMTEEVPRTVKRVPLVWSIVIALALLAASALVVNEIATGVKPMGKEFEAKLKANAAYSKTWFPLEAVDRTLKVVHVVFIDFFLAKPIHFAFLEIWILPCMILTFFQAIEFDRLAMKLVPFYIFAYQYVGIGVCWPIVMIYYLYKRNAHSGRFPGGSTAPRVVLAGASAILTTVSLVALPQLKRDGPFYFWGVNVFLLLPCIVPFLTFFIPSERAPRSALESARGQRYENLVYAFLAGMSALLYWRCLPALLEQYLAPAHYDVYSALLSVWKDLSSNGVQRFLLVDCLSSAIVIISFLLMDSGILATLFFLLAAPLVSPGTALAIYLLRREFYIYGTATGAWSTKISGSPPNASQRKHQ